jgi:hypothetical protein
VVRDAAFAARRANRPATAQPGYEPAVRLADGAVTAAVAARDTGDIVVATTSAVVCWRAGSGLVLPVLATGERTILGLSTDPAGRVVYVLYEDGEEIILRCFASTGPGPFTSMSQVTVLAPGDGPGGLYLQPSAGTADGEPVVTLDTPFGRASYRTLHLLPGPPREYLPASPAATRLLARAADCAWDWDDLFVRCLTGEGPSATGRWVPTWTPAVPPDSPLATPVVNWIAPASRVLEVAGVNCEGNLYWSEFNGRGFEAGQSRTAVAPHPDGFRAACLVAPGSVVAATGRNEVSRFRVSGTELRRTSGPVTVSTPARVVFLAPRSRANGVVAVTEDGSAVTIPGL